MFLYSVEFLILAMVIVYSGSKLSQYGDIIAEKTGLGGSLIGIVLLATITSLPELINSVSSVVLIDAPVLALGDILGSCVFNLVILAILDLWQKDVPLSTKAYYGNTLSAAIGILFLSLILLAYIVKDLNIRIFWLGFESVIIFFIYILSVRLIYIHNKREVVKYLHRAVEEKKYDHIMLKVAIKKYSINAFFVVLSATFLPYTADKLAVASGLGQCFVGSVLVGMVTSLPELVVSITAMKINAIDMAIGNILGSNIFDIFIYSLVDMIYIKDVISASLLKGHIISIISAIFMTSVLIAAFIFRAEKKRFFVSVDAFIIFVVYIVLLLFEYKLR